MKKVILMLLLAVFSLGSFANTLRQDTTRQDTTKRKKMKKNHPKQSMDSLKRDTTQSPGRTDTTRKTY